jgi:hypothetical protein
MGNRRADVSGAVPGLEVGYHLRVRSSASCLQVITHVQEEPSVFCETRPLAEEWTYRFLAAAHAWASTEIASAGRLAPSAAAAATTELAQALDAPEPSTAEVRAWARATGLAVPDRGKLRPEVWDAWRTAHRA